MSIFIFDQFYLYVDGQSIDMARDLKVEFVVEGTGAIATLKKDFAGISFGPKSLKASFTVMVPSVEIVSGLFTSQRIPEFYPFKTRMEDGQKVTLGIVSGNGKQFISDGYIVGVDYSAGIGKSVEQNVQFIGDLQASIE